MNRGLAQGILASFAAVFLLTVLFSGCGSSGPTKYEREVQAVLHDFKLVDEARAESHRDQATASEAIKGAEYAMARHEQQGFSVLMVSARRAIGRVKDRAARVRRLLDDANHYSRPAIQEATTRWMQSGHAGVR